MRIFILLAILFFSWRVFSQTFDYFYIDEYIRAQEDPQFAQYLDKKRREASQNQEAIEDYKFSKLQEQRAQEIARQEYVYKRDLHSKNDNQEKLEKEYEKQKEQEEKEIAKAEALYLKEFVEKEILAEKKAKMVQANKRVLASLLPSEERHRVPKDKRKFKFKPQSKAKH